MRFEAFINKLQGDVKFLTEESEIVGLSKHVVEEVEKVGVKPKSFSNALIEYVKDGGAYYTTYLHSKGVEECGKGTVFELWINEDRHDFVILVNYNGLSQVSFTKPEFFNVVAEQSVRNMLSTSCVDINMPYPYKFVVFETFNAFRKLSKVDFEGVIDKKLVSIDDKRRGFVWVLESPNINYSSNVIIRSE